MTENSVKLELMGKREVKYAALSYCWGPDGPETRAHITLRTNVEKREKGFKLNDLPKTLRDAVVTTRSLGIRYIWIDGLCIVQDCDAEWQQESMKMMHYYGNAYLTIVPVLSDSVATGMRHDQGNEPFSVKFPFSRSIYNGPDLHSDIVLAVKRSRYDEGLKLRNSMWMGRGWTYQEMLVSSRILFIFDYCMTLRCRMGNWDSLRGWKPSRDRAGDFLPANDVIRNTEREVGEVWSVDRGRGQWCELVKEFTKRKLSNERDRWFAFSGIAEKYFKSFNEPIVAGLLKGRLVEELVSWRPYHPSRPGVCKSERVPSDNTRSEFTFPSWSWIGKDWSGPGLGLNLNATSIDALEEHQLRAEIESIVNEGDLGSIKLQMAGYLLDEKSFPTFFGSGSIWNEPANVTFWFDHCHCPNPHDPVEEKCGDGAFDPWTVIPSLMLAVSALLIGFESTIPLLSEVKLHHWYFLLIQPTKNGISTTDTTGTCSTLPEYRRIGVLGVVDGATNSILSSMEKELVRSGKKSILLV